MYTITQRLPILRASARLLSVLAFLGFMLVLNQTTASAQPCTGSNCPGVKIYNCTSLTYTLKLNLCCGGVTVVSAPIAVPVVPCPNSAAYSYYGPSCTVIGVASIIPAPPLGAFYDPVNCIIKIY